MATQDRWNIHGQQWLASLEDMAANVEDDDPTTRLTQFEKNLMAELRTMVVKPEDETPPPQPNPSIQKRVDGFRLQAHDFFVDELDENEWSIDATPMVSLSEGGAYVQLWRWFPSEDDE